MFCVVSFCVFCTIFLRPNMGESHRRFMDPLRPLECDGQVVTAWYRAPEIMLKSRHYTTAIGGIISPLPHLIFIDLFACPSVPPCCSCPCVPPPCPILYQIFGLLAASWPRSCLGNQSSPLMTKRERCCCVLESFCCPEHHSLKWGVSSPSFVVPGS